jgi:regulatory protein
MKPRKIARRITPEYLHNAALFYLQRYAASSGRLRRVLTDKIKRSCRDHSDQDVAALLPLVEAEIEKLTRVELLADNRLLAQLIDGYRARGIATRIIAQKLQIKGFDRTIVTQALATSGGDDQRTVEFDAARRYLERRKLWPFERAPADTAPDKMTAKKKAWAALARQGYDPELIAAVMQVPAQADPY